MVKDMLGHAVEAGRKRPRERNPDARYVCLICGYTYDPKRGDAKGGIAPGTSGEDLPHDWLCPTCGKDQTYFSRRDD